MKAGNTAASAFQNDEAERFYSEALALVHATKAKGTLEHIALERKLGLAQSEQGITDRAKEHLRAGLQMLGIELPSQDAPAAKLKLKFKTPKELDWPARHEAVLALVTLAKILYYDCNRSLAQYVIYVAFKLGKSSSKSASLQDDVFPVAIMLHSTRKEFLSPEEYIALCAKSRQPGIQMPADLATGMYRAANAQWTEADVALRSAFDAAQQVGARRSLEEALVHRATVLALRGNLAESAERAAEALASARARGDAQLQLFALSCAARTQSLLAADASQVSARLSPLGIMSENSSIISFCFLFLSFFLSFFLCAVFVCVVRRAD